MPRPIPPCSLPVLFRRVNPTKPSRPTPLRSCPAPSRSHLARAPSRPPLRASPCVSPASRHAQACAVPRPLPCASLPIRVIPLVAASRLSGRFGCLRCVRRASPRLAPFALPCPARPCSLCPRRAALIFPSGLASTSPHPALSLPRPGPAQLHFVASYEPIPLHPVPSPTCSALPRSVVFHVHFAPPTCHSVLIECCFTIRALSRFPFATPLPIVFATLRPASHRYACFDPPRCFVYHFII